ncbi:MAG TPA: sugar transferase [Mariniphaga sp.]|nr:sugar transferase [Mariniphaga sp.]
MMYLFVKRFLDLLLSIIGLLVLIPILVITVIAIKLESKGPVFFIQKRLGQSGNVFWIIKFRSMKTGAEKGGVYSDKNDNRVTRVGKFIRATSIDELPQLINIIKGEMSIIGPRPTLTYHPWPLEEYTTEQKKRFEVKPGVTGWAQINGRKELMWDQRLQFDIEYVNNLSFAFDLKIFFKTIFMVFTMKNNTNTGETVIKY